MNTIIELQSELEELEKRIKAISSAQSSLSQLMAISEYFDRVQSYLSMLNNSYNNHLVECEDYATQISSLQEQINTLSDIVQNGGGSGNVDTSQLQQDLATLSQSLEDLKDGSTTTISDIDLQLNNLQTDHQNMQDSIDQNATDISSINQTISSMQSEITNLTTTQNNLSSSHVNLTGTVNSINTRLTTAETNINSLTGGVDLSEFENRLSAVENTNYMWHNYAYKKYEFFDAESENFKLYTREYYYACAKDIVLYQDIKLNYTTTCEGTMAVTFLSNFIEQETITINLAQNPNGYTIKRQIWPSTEANNIMIKCVATGLVKYNSIEMTMHGKGLYIFNDYKDVKVVYFDGFIYVTRAYMDGIRYGKFTSEEDIDLENLPNFKSYHDVAGDYSYMLYTAFPKPNNTTSIYTEKRDDTIIKVRLNTNQQFLSYADGEEGSYYSINADIPRGNDFFPCIYGSCGMPMIYKAGIRIADLEYGGTISLTNINLPSVTEWLFCTLANYNYNNMTDTFTNSQKIAVVAYGNDGYWYFIKNRQLTKSCQICKGGIDATAYTQQDGTYHVYVSFGSYVKKFKIYTTRIECDTCDLIETIPNCNCVFELLNNKRLKNTPSGWALETIDDVTE